VFTDITELFAVAAEAWCSWRRQTGARAVIRQARVKTTSYIVLLSPVKKTFYGLPSHSALGLLKSILSQCVKLSW